MSPPHTSSTHVDEQFYELVARHDESATKVNHQDDSSSMHLKPDFQRPPRSRWNKAVTHWWLWEWLAFLVAMSAIAAIVGVLIAFDKRPIPDWPYGITLTALVSVLATIATVGLAEPLAAGLGQARWLWYTKERGLADFELIDGASRGPVGSVMLILRGKGGFFAIMGGVLLIASQAIGPFAQQVVQYDQKEVNQAPGYLPIAEEYNTYATDGGDVSLSMKAAIKRGIMDASANTSSFFVDSRCPTGNCTWPADNSYYTSLSVCGRCANVSSELSRVENDGYANLTLPNNITLEYIPASTGIGLIAMTINTTSEATKLLVPSLEFSEYQYPIANFFTIIAEYDNYRDNQGPMGPFASECIIQFCIQNYTASSINGTFTETPHEDPIYIDGVYEFTAEDGGQNYTLDYETFKALRNYFTDQFNVQIHQQNGLSASAQWHDDISQSLFYWTNSSTDHIPTQMIHDLAASMSLNVRSSTNLTQSGIATSQISIVAVRWPWMIFPLAILVLVGSYLVGTSVVTSRNRLEPWKTSSLAVLMHGISREESQSLIEGSAEGLDEMGELAERLRMKMVVEAVDESVDGSSASHDRRMHVHTRSTLIQLAGR